MANLKQVISDVSNKRQLSENTAKSFVTNYQAIPGAAQMSLSQREYEASKPNIKTTALYQQPQQSKAQAIGAGMAQIPGAVGGMLKGVATGFAKGASGFQTIGDVIVGQPTKALGETLADGTDNFWDRYSKNLEDKRTDTKFMGKKLLDPNFEINKEVVRDFVGSSMEFPTFFYGGGKGLQTAMQKGAPAASKALATGLIGGQTGAVAGVLNKYKETGTENLGEYVGSAAAGFGIGAVAGAGLSLAGSAVGGAVNQVKAGKFVDNLKLGDDVARNLTQSQKSTLYKLSENGVKPGALKKAARELAAETLSVKVAKQEGKVVTGNQSLDTLVNGIKESYAKLPDVKAQRRAESAIRASKASEATAGVKDPLEALRLAREATGGDFGLEKNIQPVKLSKKALIEIGEMIDNDPELRGKGIYSINNAKQALADLVEGRAPIESNLELLSQAVGYDLSKVTGTQTWQDRLQGSLLAYGGFKRSVIASGDISGTFRQAFPAVTEMLYSGSGRRDLQQSFTQSLKYIADENLFRNDMLQLMDSPSGQAALKFGVKLSKVGRKVAGSGEEMFSGDIAEKFVGTKWFVNPSERQYVGFLNDLRVKQFAAKSEKILNSVDVGDDFINKMAKKYGFDSPEFNTAIMKKKEELAYDLLSDTAKLVNDSTGAGKLDGPRLKKFAGALNATLFAPGLMKTRLSYLNPLNYNPLDPVGRMRLKQFSAMFATSIGFLRLAELAGAKVEKDPRSTSFGKAQFGNTKIDMLGGFQPYIRFAAQQITGETKSSSGKITRLDSQFGGPTRLGQVGQFARGKINPLAGDLIDLWSGTNIVGEPQNLPQKILEISPLAWQDIFDAVRSNPESSAFFKTGVSAAALLGAGVQSKTELDDAEMKAKQKEAKELMKTGTTAEIAKYRLTGLK
jgi:hypothetical protein